MTVEAFIERFCGGCENNRPDNGRCLVSIPDNRRFEIAEAYERALLSSPPDEPIRKSDFCCSQSPAKPETVLTSGRV